MCHSHAVISILQRFRRPDQTRRDRSDGLDRGLYSPWIHILRQSLPHQTDGYYTHTVIPFSRITILTNHSTTHYSHSHLLFLEGWVAGTGATHNLHVSYTIRPPPGTDRPEFHDSEVFILAVPGPPNPEAVFQHLSVSPTFYAHGQIDVRFGYWEL